LRGVPLDSQHGTSVAATKFWDPPGTCDTWTPLLQACVEFKATKSKSYKCQNLPPHILSASNTVTESTKHVAFLPDLLTYLFVVSPSFGHILLGCSTLSTMSLVPSWFSGKLPTPSYSLKGNNHLEPAHLPRKHDCG